MESRSGKQKCRSPVCCLQRLPPPLPPARLSCPTSGSRAPQHAPRTSRTREPRGGRAAAGAQRWLHSALWRRRPAPRPPPRAGRSERGWRGRSRSRCSRFPERVFCNCVLKSAGERLHSPPQTPNVNCQKTASAAC